MAHTHSQTHQLDGVTCKWQNKQENYIKQQAEFLFQKYFCFKMIIKKWPYERTLSFVKEHPISIVYKL